VNDAEDLLEQAPETCRLRGMLRHDDRLALVIDLRRSRSLPRAEHLTNSEGWGRE